MKQIETTATLKKDVTYFNMKTKQRETFARIGEEVEVKLTFIRDFIDIRVQGCEHDSGEITIDDIIIDDDIDLSTGERPLMLDVSLDNEGSHLPPEIWIDPDAQPMQIFDNDDGIEDTSSDVRDDLHSPLEG